LEERERRLELDTARKLDEERRKIEDQAVRQVESAFDETGCGRVGPSIARAGHSPRRWGIARPSAVAVLRFSAVPRTHR
jgi:hypothetical protein